MRKLYPELPKEEGMYPIVKGTFEANLTIVDEPDDEPIEGNRQTRDEAEDEEEPSRKEPQESVAPIPSPNERDFERPEQDRWLKFINDEGVLDA